MSGSMSIGRDFEFAGFTALGGLLRNEALFNDIVDHGCWCAKLDPMSESSMLGGSTPIDEMDEICRRWFVARHCNDDLDGGSCRAYKIADNYLLNPAGYDAAGYASACDAANQVAETDIDANGQFDDPWQDAEGNPYNPSTCVHDSCLIDAYYSDLIISYWNDNNATWAKAVIADYDTCLLPEFMDMERTCTGSAPNVVIKNDSSYKSNARGMLPRAPSTDAPAAGGAGDIDALDCINGAYNATTNVCDCTFGFEGQLCSQNATAVPPIDTECAALPKIGNYIFYPSEVGTMEESVTFCLNEGMNLARFYNMEEW